MDIVHCVPIKKFTTRNPRNVSVPTEPCKISKANASPDADSFSNSTKAVDHVYAIRAWGESRVDVIYVRKVK